MFAEQIQTEAVVDPALAACRGVGVEVFFPQDIPGIDVAKAICGTCGLREACLAGALERNEAAGVWGGELFEDGKIIAQKRPRGRPRKVVAVAIAEPEVEVQSKSGSSAAA